MGPAEEGQSPEVHVGRAVNAKERRLADAGQAGHFKGGRIMYELSIGGTVITPVPNRYSHVGSITRAPVNDDLHHGVVGGGKRIGVGLGVVGGGASGAALRKAVNRQVTLAINDRETARRNLQIMRPSPGMANAIVSPAWALVSAQ